MKLSACIEMLFCEAPFSQRALLARQAGLDAFEFWGFADKDPDLLQQMRLESGLPIAAFCVGTRDAHKQAAYAQGQMLNPGNRALFVELVAESLQLAQRLGAARLITVPGAALPDTPRYAQHDAIIRALAEAAPLCERAGVPLVIEPLNPINHPGMYLVQSDEAFEIAQQVGSSAVKVLFDVYHQQISEGNLTERIRGGLAHIGHFHVADVPGRGQPGTGELAWPHLLTAIEQSGYDGYIGLEYQPTCDTRRSLEHVCAAAQAARKGAMG
ncbi:MAG: hydroxypyruvate isomerase family protein [Christensenellales bacterium]|jgi:hydroxypyruvate isomerase